MTRQEPKFGDDLTATPPEVPATPVTPTQSRTPDVPPKPSTPWLLWLFVLVSLAVSFGVALFGLEEAGRYQAALTRAQDQADTLEETIARLNEAQAEGIGELAQSDAQMRQTVLAVETRLRDELSEELAQLSEATQSSERQTLANRETLQSLQDNTQTAISRLEEALALVSEQLNQERTRLDDLAETRNAVQTLRTEVEQLTSIVDTVDAGSEAQQAEIDSVAQSLVALQASLSVLEDQMQSGGPAALGVEVLSEEVEQLAQQLAEQNELLQAVDASRQQLTRRIIDLDEQVNQLRQPGDAQ